MVTEDMLLNYFYKQNRTVFIDDLFEKFGSDDSILKAVQYLVNYDWLNEDKTDPLNWSITDEGRNEYQRRQTMKNSYNGNNVTINGHGNVVNTGILEGEINVNIKVLNKAGLCKISNSISDLAERIKSANDIVETRKIAYFEILKDLSEQATKPKEKRLSNSTITQMINHGLGSLEAVSSIATIAGVSIRDIASYFLSS